MTRRVRGGLVALVVSAVVLLGVASLLDWRTAAGADSAAGGDEEAMQAECHGHIQDLAVGITMYVQDYDELYPLADKWCDLTVPYVKGRWQRFHCPTDTAEFSYAMNHKLSRLPEEKIQDPFRTILLYESASGRKNKCDQHGRPGDSVPDPPRHRGGNHFAFADGHVRWLAPDAVALDLYRVVKEEQYGSGHETEAQETKR